MAIMSVHRDAESSMIDFRSQNAVKIYISSSPSDEFTVPHAVLCRSSGVLKRILDGNKIKPSTSVAVDADLIELEVYLNWLYTGTLHLKRPDENDPEDEYTEYESLVDGYLLGNKLEDREYCNAVISALFAKAEECKHKETEILPNGACIKKAKAAKSVVTDEARLYDALVEIFARSESFTGIGEALEDDGLDIKFLKDLIYTLRTYGKDLRSVSVCDFHTHVGHERCIMREPSRKRRRER